MKHIFKFLLLLICNTIALNTFATSGTCGEKLNWYLENNVLTIFGEGVMNNYGSSSNLPPWYAYRDNIKIVIIKNSVESIGDYAFDCCNLTSVTIGNSVTSIGSYAFNGCSITSIAIPNSVTSIGSYAFSSCRSLTSVHINDIAAWCAISFGSNPLSYAHNLYLNDELVKDLVIPDTVTSIGDYAFFGCTGLTSVTIPNSVTSIGNYTFRNYFNNSFTMFNSEISNHLF